MAINFWFSFVLSLDFAEHKTITRLESKWRKNDSQYCVLNAWYLDTLSHRPLGDFDSTQCHLGEAGLDPRHGSLLPGPLPFSSEPAVFSVVVDADVYWPLIEFAKEMAFSLQLWLSELPGFHLHRNKHIIKMLWLASKMFLQHHEQFELLPESLHHPLLINLTIPTEERQTNLDIPRGCWWGQPCSRFIGPKQSTLRWRAQTLISFSSLLGH